jgi:hypothetical protein
VCFSIFPSQIPILTPLPVKPYPIPAILELINSPYEVTPGKLSLSTGAATNSIF